MFHKNGELKEIGRRYDEEDTYFVLFFSKEIKIYLKDILYIYSIVSKKRIN